MELSFIQTITLAILIVLLGAKFRSKVKILEELALPVATLGGLLYFLFSQIATEVGLGQLVFKFNADRPFMLAFFASVGMAASFALLRSGGKFTAIFLVAAAGLLLAQNTIGILGALAWGESPYLGLVLGSITMSGGKGTALAWSETFATEYGVEGLQAIALACATLGVVCGGLTGGPVARRLILKFALKPSGDSTRQPLEPDKSPLPYKQVFTAESVLVHSLLLLGCVLFADEMPTKLGNFTVPAFLWAIVAGIVVRAVVEKHPRFRPEAVEVLGEAALSIFIVVAMANLDWAQVGAYWLPMVTVVPFQVAAVVIFTSYVTFKMMGRDYDAAVICAGHSGFGLGATPNAVNNMVAVSNRYGASPKALLVVPLVGAFFIDIINAVVLQSFVSLF